MSEKIKISELFEALPDFLEEYARECEYPWELLRRVQEITEKIISASPHGYTEYSRGVLVGRGVRIAESARIEPPAVIGEDCEIRHCAYLRGGVLLGKGVVIGNSSELKNCVLLDGAQVPHYNYVGDSILGNRAHMGAGAICSNLRSDGASVRIHTDRGDIDTGMRKLGAMLGDGAEIGCGSVLAPGCIVGKSTTVYPLTLARGVIPPDSILKQNGEIIKKQAAR